MKFNKLFVIGDIGGWSNRFYEALSLAGVDIENMIIPDGVAILQMGDLTRIVPEFKENNGNRSVVDIAIKLRSNNPDSYFQLLGNHDLIYMNRVTVMGEKTRNNYHHTVEQDVVESLRAVEQFASPFLSIESNGKSYIATHAGVTRGAIERARRYNAQHTRNRYTDGADPITKKHLDIWKSLVSGIVSRNVSMSPSLLETGYENMAADHFFAECIYELDKSWRNGCENDVAINQIVGHSTPYNWKLDEWRKDTPLDIVLNGIVDPISLSVFIKNEFGSIIFTDPVWGNYNDSRRRQDRLVELCDVNIIHG